MANEVKAITDLLDFLKPDWSKVDKAKLKSAADLFADAMKPATTWPGDWDDSLWDMLKDVVVKYITGMQDGGHVVVGAAGDVSIADVNEFFSYTKLDKKSEVGKKLLRNTKAIGLLQANFTQAEQAQVVGNPILIALLTIFGPLVLDLIKAWLAKLNKPKAAVKEEKKPEGK